MCPQSTNSMIGALKVAREEGIDEGMAGEEALGGRGLK